MSVARTTTSAEYESPEGVAYAITAWIDWERVSDGADADGNRSQMIWDSVDEGFVWEVENEPQHKANEHDAIICDYIGGTILTQLAEKGTGGGQV